MNRRIAGAIGGVVGVASIAVIVLLATRDEPAAESTRDRRFTRSETPAVAKPTTPEPNPTKTASANDNEDPNKASDPTPKDPTKTTPKDPLDPTKAAPKVRDDPPKVALFTGGNRKVLDNILDRNLSTSLAKFNGLTGARLDSRVQFTSIEATNVAISTHSIRTVLERASSKLDRCYADRRRVKPGVDGLLSLTIEVDVDGASTKTIAIGDKPLATCIENALAGQRFARPINGRVTFVSASLAFR